MMPTQQRILSFASPEETASFAANLAPKLRPGDVLLLGGGLGAGKTHFARALIQTRLAQAGMVEDVPSPTFTLVQTYFDETVEIWHADLYRLSHLDEVTELGLEDAFEAGICLIEWPDRLGDLTPENAVSLEFAMTDKHGERTVKASWSDPRWSDRLDVCNE